MFHILLLAVSLRRKLSLWLPWKALHISWDWTTEYIVQPQKISGNMFAWELQSSGAWQPCEWRCPSWEREFLFPRQLMWAWGWDVPGNPLPLLGGQGRVGEQLRDVGVARCHHCCRASRRQGEDDGHRCLCTPLTSVRQQLLKADNKNARQSAQALLLRPLAKELIPTPSSNLKTTVSPHSSCQNLQVPPQLP